MITEVDLCTTFLFSPHFDIICVQQHVIYFSTCLHPGMTNKEFLLDIHTFVNSKATKS